MEVLAGFFSDGITDEFKKTARTVTAVYIADGITDGFEMSDPYGDVSIVPSESSTVSPMECPSGKVNICPIYRPSPPLFLLLLPNPNSPNLQTTSPPSPPNKNLGPERKCKCYNGYFVNGYVFHTEEYGHGRKTTKTVFVLRERLVVS